MLLYGIIYTLYAFNIHETNIRIENLIIKGI